MAASIATITGTICKADGTPIASSQVKATIKSTEQDQGGQVAGSTGISSEVIEAFTKDDGTFAIDLVAGATVLLEIPAINLRKEIVVPEAASSTEFTTLI